MFSQLDHPGCDTAQVAVHREMKRRVIAFGSTEKLFDRDADVQLFLYLTFKCLLRAFSGLDLSPRELPSPLKLSIPALGG